MAFAAIEGVSIDSVTLASEKIRAIIDEVSCLSMQSLNLKKLMAIFTFVFQFVILLFLKCIVLVGGVDFVVTN